ncbi:Dak1 domain-containing protein [Pseudoneurospora amorphoporcata]|uniref:Dak1 domain-containing protein n=1 Tax=Pseudoneurospora amorphoporcata TaxID=241081 RepID=A0AAN6SDI2_9PEZI|nr:Dak1 domain-containing protein [Pseudoneurospora amorphoporcata]
MSNRHFINDPNHLVLTALQSTTLLNPGVALDVHNKIVYLRPGYGSSSHQKQNVSLISGGGSGHEPSFSSMVGRGLLSACVAGTIFASPSAEQVRTAIMGRVDNNNSPHGDGDAAGGVLVVVMNYTGDVLNFGLAVEKAKAAGVNVEMVVVGDDVGVGRAKAGKVGRRGIAGTVLVQKIAGALASQGRSLKEVTHVAKLVAENLVSVGASLEHVHVPGRRAETHGAEEKVLKEGEVEIGMGIHNEQGSSREKGIGLPELVGKMLKQLLDQNDKDRAFLNVNSNEVVLLVNNLGGVSPLEMGGIVAEVVAQLGEKPYGIKPARILSGTYMTSLNGLGFSISLLNVVNTDIGGPGMIELLDYPCEATGWTAPISKLTWEEQRDNKQTRENDAKADEEVRPCGLTFEQPAETQKQLVAGLKAVIAAEPEVTKYDTTVGDGDCGIGLKRGAEAILSHLNSNPLTGDAAIDLSKIVAVVEQTMDGTSGALYGIFLNALVASLHTVGGGESDKKVADGNAWAAALKLSCEALSKYTPARPGDRTLIDALYPFVDALEKTGDVKKAAEAAKQGAEGTKGMKANLGRTVYIGGSGFEQVPDPGAWGLAKFFLGLAGIEKSDGSSSSAKQAKGSDDGWEEVSGEAELP